MVRKDTTTYVYDTANQLLRENNKAAGKTWVWTYDNAGNILSRTEYAYTTADDPGTALDTVTYAYTSENWGDLLKTYDGGTLYYDYCGNLTSDPTWRYTWEHGRQLATMAAKDGSVTWNYAYDVDGLRLSRTDGATEYGYVYLGGELVRMTIDDDVVMLFAYDADGTPMSVVYNGTTYYYAKNVQGDVVAILSNTGKPVVYYTYDAWGNILSVTGTKANTLGADNPLRYRGYVYDTETELYYLQSRYYNPEWGRFINADAFVSTGQGFVGNNMFAYCGNNPVCYKDPSGTAFVEALIIAVGTEWAVTIIVCGIVIVSEALYVTLEALVNWFSTQWYSTFAQVTYTAEETLPAQGLVEGDPEAPKVDAGKQGKHVPGHNNYNKNKSSWPEGQNGVSQTQEAWQNGVPDPKKPDGSVRIGIASDGTVVRVHMGGNGAIHGYPIFFVG